jgi:hypothetical protein
MPAEETAEGTAGPAAGADAVRTGGRWDRDDPRLDRAAGALVGAAAAAGIVGAPADAVAELTGPGGGSTPARLGRVITAALRALDDPAAAPAFSGAEETAWALALRRTAADGAVPGPDGTAPSTPMGASWRAAAHTPVPALDPARGRFPCAQYVDAVWRAAAAAGDLAAMYAGALAGARWGVSGVPVAAQRRVADTAEPRDLVVRAVLLARGADPDQWPERSTHHTGTVDCVHTPFSVAHPHDPGVVLGNLEFLRSDHDLDAVVTLNRLGPEDVCVRVPARDRVEMWLADREGVNPNLHFVLDQAAGAVAALRAEGRRVLLHCAAGQSRTPAVAAHYAARSRGVPVVRALREIITAVGGHLDTPGLARAAAALNGVDLPDPAADLFPDGLPPRRGRTPVA